MFGRMPARYATSSGQEGGGGDCLAGQMMGLAGSVCTEFLSLCFWSFVLSDQYTVTGVCAHTHTDTQGYTQSHRHNNTQPLDDGGYSGCKLTSVFVCIWIKNVDIDS